MLPSDSPIGTLFETKPRAVAGQRPKPAEPRKIVTGGLAPHRLRRVIDHAEAHLGEPLRLADLAQIAKVSPKHFSRAFTQSMGLPPHRWVIEKRIAAARHLLRQADKPLSAIALECGFADQSHFTSLFRRHVGVPPGLWRKARDGQQGHAA